MFGKIGKIVIGSLALVGACCIVKAIMNMPPYDEMCCCGDYKAEATENKSKPDKSKPDNTKPNPVYGVGKFEPHDPYCMMAMEHSGTADHAVNAARCWFAAGNFTVEQFTEVKENLMKDVPVDTSDEAMVFARDNYAQGVTTTEQYSNIVKELKSHKKKT